MSNMNVIINACSNNSYFCVSYLHLRAYAAYYFFSRAATLRESNSNDFPWLSIASSMFWRRLIKEECDCSISVAIVNIAAPRDDCCCEVGKTEEGFDWCWICDGERLFDIGEAGIEVSTEEERVVVVTVVEAEEDEALAIGKDIKVQSNWAQAEEEAREALALALLTAESAMMCFPLRLIAKPLHLGKRVGSWAEEEEEEEEEGEGVGDIGSDLTLVARIFTAL